MINYIFNFFIGIALFIFGMNNLTNGLKKSNKNKIEKIIRKASGKVKGVLWGTLITALIQSSSFITVLLVGLVDSGIMTINNTIGLIMGSNIGTCITSWIISISSLNKDVLSIFSLDSLLGIFASIALLFLITKRHNKANIIFGLLTLILGMNLMTKSMAPLANFPFFQKIITYLSNPILGLILGIILTGIFQSSSLIIGILEGLALNVNISFLAGYTLILGSNIGTCVTAIIASTTTNKNSKIVSMFHLVFNIVGTLIFLIGFYILNYFLKFSFTYQNINAFQIALIHTVFNLGSTIILLPFTNQLINISKKLIKEKRHN